MPWMLTASGHQVRINRPRPEQIVIADIAHHLSQINRFNGAACRPYSVAEHSLLVAEIVEREFGLGVHGQLAALMQDAHEAWVGDVSSPVKEAIGPAWSEVEGVFEHTVRACFALTTAFVVWRHEIKLADLMALATERRDLLPPQGEEWPCLRGVRPVEWVDLRERGRLSFTWMDWRDAFLERYHELDFGRIEASREFEARTARSAAEGDAR